MAHGHTEQIHFKGTTASWNSVILVSTAGKPHASALEAVFSSTSPNSGNYTVVSLGDVTSYQQYVFTVTSYYS